MEITPEVLQQIIAAMGAKEVEVIALRFKVAQLEQQLLLQTSMASNGLAPNGLAPNSMPQNAIS